MIYKDQPGKSYPLGATVTADGVNFAIYSKRADFLDLLLFESDDSPIPFAEYRLTPEKNRTSNYWHIFLQGLRPGQVYAWRVHGAYDPAYGMRFDSNKVLLDPYSLGIVGWRQYCRKAAIKEGDNCPVSLRSVVLDCNNYDWENDRSPGIPYSSTIIYELHVGGFTANPNSLVCAEKRGTYAGLIEKIPYLKDLGVTAIELMPVQAFDKDDAPEGLTNYWGYSPLGFFAPHIGYSSIKTAQGALDEFRDMVKACHKNGLEVILDVVFNHTTENDDKGPTISFKGLDNLTYYTLDQNDYSYKNFSGCGNSLRAEHPVVGRLILDSLRFWVEDMHVDGFRFDLASVLTRDIFGKPSDRPPLLWAIESDPILASSKLIAEAWDPAGLYQVGMFVTRGNRFAEWNGPFRDDVRCFVKGDNDSVRNLASRLSGSNDIYGYIDRDPRRSIQFVTCHDGFSLNDLVSYNQKHNDANKEENRDGNNYNFSWNCGVEGDTDYPEIEELRNRQIRNFLTIMFLSQGTPMLSMGDELRRSVKGNNNPYCQNDESNWFDWDLLEKHRDLFNFTRHLIEFSQRLNLRRLGHTITQLESSKQEKESSYKFTAATLKWHGTDLDEPDFNSSSHSLAVEMKDPRSSEHLYAALNAYWEPLTFQLPEPKNGEDWHKIIDTSLAYPENIVDLHASPAMADDKILVPARSTVVLINTGGLSQSARRRTMTRSMLQNQGITWTNMKRPVLPS